ncbi:MAG: FecR domain-containing protein [Rhodothermus sp.]|nr:FecR domain-containing protein [Rhodothermus sp.]
MNGRLPAELPRELEAALQERGPEERRQIQALWVRLGALEPSVEKKVPSTDAAWEALAARLAATARPARPPRRTFRRRWPVLIGLVLGMIGTYALLRTRTLTVPPGTIQTITLDGTTITLRAGSQLRYAPVLPGRRLWRVRLIGEALFEVVPGHSLRVETAQAHVEVLGTRFNVRAWPEAHETRVTLLEGRVQIRPRGISRQLLVLERPGQSVRINREGVATPERSVPEQVLAWRQGGFVVIDEPVGVVLRELERTFALRIEVAGPLPLDRRVTVLYQQPTSPEAILQDLCLTLPCYYRRISRGFVVEAAPSAGH